MRNTYNKHTYDWAAAVLAALLLSMWFDWYSRARPRQTDASAALLILCTAESHIKGNTSTSAYKTVNPRIASDWHSSCKLPPDNIGRMNVLSDHGIRPFEQH